MLRNIIRVLPFGDKWKITFNSHFHSAYYIKATAIEKGRIIAKANRPSQLVIHKGDGTIETEYTYGDDPFPPRG